MSNEMQKLKTGDKVLAHFTVDSKEVNVMGEIIKKFERYGICHFELKLDKGIERVGRPTLTNKCIMCNNCININGYIVSDNKTDIIVTYAKVSIRNMLIIGKVMHVNDVGGITYKILGTDDIRRKTKTSFYIYLKPTVKRINNMGDGTQKNVEIKKYLEETLSKELQYKHKFRFTLQELASRFGSTEPEIYLEIINSLDCVHSAYGKDGGINVLGKSGYFNQPIKLKTRILKFSYKQLEELCEEKGWSIPTSKDLVIGAKQGFECSHDLVWISDEALPVSEEDKRYGVKIGLVMSTKTGFIYERNKNWLTHVVVKENNVVDDLMRGLEDSLKNK